MHRLQLYHAVAKRPNDPPTPGGSSHAHRRGANNLYPNRHHEYRSLEEIKPRGKLIEIARFCAGKKRERDYAHRFLRVVCAVTVGHPGGAEDLEFSKKRINKMRGESMQRHKEQKHQEAAKNESGHWRNDHGNHNFRPHADVPFYDRPIATGGGQGRAAKSADQRMARARRQAEPPGRDIPDERGDERTKDSRHCNHVCVHQSFADCRRNRAAEQRAGQIKKRGHRNRLPRREHFGRDDGRDGVGRIVKAVGVLEDDCCKDDNEEKQHVDLAGSLGVF